MLHPNIVILKLIDTGNFLRGADRFCKEDPMIFINKVIELIEAGASMRQDLADNSADSNPTQACDDWDKSLRSVEFADKLSSETI